MKSIRVILVCLGLLASFQLLANPLSQAAVLSATCFTCHQTEGDKFGTVPSIAGWSAKQIESKLLDYKYDRRPSTIMSRLVKGYTDKQITLIANYFASPAIERK